MEARQGGVYFPPLNAVGVTPGAGGSPPQPPALAEPCSGSQTARPEPPQPAGCSHSAILVWEVFRHIMERVRGSREKSEPEYFESHTRLERRRGDELSGLGWERKALGCLDGPKRLRPEGGAADTWEKVVSRQLTPAKVSSQENTRQYHVKNSQSYIPKSWASWEAAGRLQTQPPPFRFMYPVCKVHLILGVLFFLQENKTKLKRCPHSNIHSRTEKQPLRPQRHAHSAAEQTSTEMGRSVSPFKFVLFLP